MPYERPEHLRIVTTLACITTPQAAHADDTQNWETVTVPVALGGPWRVWNETVVRASDAKGFSESVNNLMLGDKLNKHVTRWAGYTHAPQHLHGNFTVMEYCARQQVTLDNIH